MQNANIQLFFLNAQPKINYAVEEILNSKENNTKKKKKLKEEKKTRQDKKRN